MELTLKTLVEEVILNDRVEVVDTICFLGCCGERDEWVGLVNVAKELGYETAIYTGANSIDGLEFFDYIKIGEYNEALGPITSQTTNQRMFYKGEDITNKFWR